MPDVSFVVKQDVDGDGTEETIYEGAFDVPWGVLQPERDTRGVPDRGRAALPVLRARGVVRVARDRAGRADAGQERTDVLQRRNGVRDAAEQAAPGRALRQPGDATRRRRRSSASCSSTAATTTRTPSTTG